MVPWRPHPHSQTRQKSSKIFPNYEYNNLDFKFISINDLCFIGKVFRSCLNSTFEDPGQLKKASLSWGFQEARDHWKNILHALRFPPEIECPEQTAQATMSMDKTMEYEQIHMYSYNMPIMSSLI